MSDLTPIAFLYQRAGHRPVEEARVFDCRHAAKAFRHKRRGYIDAYVMYQLLQDPDHWPTADDVPGG